MTALPRPRPRPVLGALALVICAALWSLNGPLIKLLNQPGALASMLSAFGVSAGAPAEAGSGFAPSQTSFERVSPWTIASYRSLFGAAVFVPLARRRRSTLKNVSGRWLVASAVTFLGMTATFVVATTMTKASNAIVLQYTSPLWVFALSPWLLGERPERREAGVLAIVLLGVAIIFMGGERGDLAGLLVALSSGVSYGALTVVLRGVRNVDPRVVVALNTLTSGLLLLPFVAAYGSFVLAPAQVVVMAFMGIVQFAVPYLLFSWGVRHIEAHRAALITLLEVVLNPLWTWLLVGEVPPAATLVGGPVILAGVALWIVAVLHRQRRNAAAIATQGAARVTESA